MGLRVKDLELVNLSHMVKRFMEVALHDSYLWCDIIVDMYDDILRNVGSAI